VYCGQGHGQFTRGTSRQTASPFSSVKIMSQQAPTGGDPAHVMVRLNAAWTPKLGTSVIVHPPSSPTMPSRYSVRPTDACWPVMTTPLVVLPIFALNHYGS
jgi:hypothetical protein